MALLANQQIEISFALREQSPNIYMLTEGAEKFPHTPQIFVCRKREVASAFLEEYYYLDSLDTKASAHLTRDVADVMSTWEHKYHYIATVDSQIEFVVKRRLFDKLSEYLYPAWSPDYVFSSLSNQPTAFLVLLRVYKICDDFPEELLKKGRQGAAMIYRLYSGTCITSRSVHSLQPVLADSKFDYIKHELINIIKIENAFIECYENDANGRLSLESKAEIRRAFAPKRAVESQPVDRAHMNYDTIYNRILEIDPSLHFLIQMVKTITPPQWGEADIMVKRAQQGDMTARSRVFEMFMRIVLKNALWMHETYEVPLDDAIQESGIGLLTAIEKFEASTQTKFSVYAPWWMRQRMMRELPVREHITRLPIHFRERIINITPMVNEHSCEACGTNSPCRNLLAEIQRELDCNENDAMFAWSFTQSPYSIEDLNGSEETAELLSDHEEQLNSVVEQIDYTQLVTAIDKALCALKPREREVIELRYGLTGNAPMTLEEIGTSFGLTRERIRQIESRALERLRKQKKLISITESDCRMRLRPSGYLGSAPKQNLVFSDLSPEK